MTEIRFFATPAGRSQPMDFLDGLPAADRAAIVADLESYAEHGADAPVSWKPIKGHRPMFEVRTYGFRSYCATLAGMLWVLHVGRKQDQRRDIETAKKRLESLSKG